MSLTAQGIDSLLDHTDGDRFLLCTIASRRARDINDMLRGQETRAQTLESASVVDISMFSKTNPLSLAMKEIDDGDLSFVKDGDPLPVSDAVNDIIDDEVEQQEQDAEAEDAESSEEE